MNDQLPLILAVADLAYSGGETFEILGLCLSKADVKADLQSVPLAEVLDTTSRLQPALIIIGHRPHRLAVQCKRRSRPVGAGAVQEVVAGAPMQDCTQTMVVTNHEFTPAARKLAELHGCELVGGAELPRLRSTIRRLTQPTSS